MKKLIPILLLPLAPLIAAPIAYEGFSDSSRNGWDGSWKIIEGDAEIVRESLSIPNLSDSEGYIKLGKDSGVVCDMSTPLTDKFYGSYRAHSSKLVEDSFISLVIQDFGADQLDVKDAPLSISLKGWKLDHGSLKVFGAPIPFNEVSSIESENTYLVLWKVENITDTNSPYCTINVWTLNEAQAAFFSSSALNDLALSSASIGDASGQVTQRVSHRTKNGKSLEFPNGASVGMVSRFGPGAIFDEITLSSESLAAAAGVNMTVSSLIER